MTPAHKSTLRALLFCASIPGALTFMVSPFLGVVVFVYVFVLAGAVGYPLYLLLSRISGANLFTACLIGFLIGVVPVAYSSWPLRHPELKGTASRGSGPEVVYTKIAGIPTSAGWNDYYRICAIFGALGTSAGAGFWYWKMRRPNKSLERP